MPLFLEILQELHTKTDGQGVLGEAVEARTHATLRLPEESIRDQVNFKKRKKRWDFLPKIADFSASSISRAFVKGSAILASISGAYKVLWVLQETRILCELFLVCHERKEWVSPYNSGEILPHRQDLPANTIPCTEKKIRYKHLNVFLDTGIEYLVV